MKKYNYIFYILTLVLVHSCTNVSEEDLIDNTPLQNMVNFDDDIKVIMENNCIACHNNPPVNGASTPLLTYQNVVDGVENNSLIPRIDSGNMPLGGQRLPQNLIDLIILWKDEGYLESQ